MLVKIFKILADNAVKNFAVIFVLLLTGCAHDNYVILPDGEGSKEAMADDLYNCKMEAIHVYEDSQPSMTGGQVLGMAASGVIGGAIGGAVYGAASGSEDNGAMKRSEINPYVEKCMLKKGYKGTSN